MYQKIDELAIATIRSLCIDMINKAKSGHPGMALGSAPILYTLFTRHLVSYPKDPEWINRDRFVLSGGHASSLLYSLLHLSGYDLSLDDLKNFRQLGSKTPGHPEVGVTPGVDASTGPLGQGLGEAIGLAMAETMLQKIYPKGNKLINHYTYCLCGDGCLQEGISQEAITFAGSQKLNKLIVFYDSNNVTLDGPLSLSDDEDVKGRFIAANWNFIEVEDGNDIEAIDEAIKLAKKSKDKPTLIKVNTIIGYGSSKQGTNKVHGAPLGEEDGKQAKVECYHFDHPDFFIPEEVKQYFMDTIFKRGEKAYNKYNEMFEKYTSTYPSESKQFIDFRDNDYSSYLPDELPTFEVGKVKATRNASGENLNYLVKLLPNLIGGSADVASSVQTVIKDGKIYSPEHRDGKTICYGIREIAMTAIANGLLLHKGIRTYVGSFFVFSDYLKPAIRLACLQQLPMIYLFSHDSIAVGEDGPTHQPVEQLAMLRSLPNLNVIRPCDDKETFGAWKLALHSKTTPTAILLSRQGLPTLKDSDPTLVNKGAYIISDRKGFKYIIIATGSEVDLALKVQAKLDEEKIPVRVVSMPCTELFDAQDEKYQKEVLPLGKDKRISLEMLSTFGWGKYADHNYGIDHFGSSAKAADVINANHFDVDSVVSFVKGVK